MIAPVDSFSETNYTMCAARVRLGEEGNWKPNKYFISNTLNG